MGQDQSFPSPADALCPCRILVVGPKSGDDCLSELAYLPKAARIGEKWMRGVWYSSTNSNMY